MPKQVVKVEIDKIVLATSTFLILNYFISESENGVTTGKVFYNRATTSSSQKCSMAINNVLHFNQNWLQKKFSKS